MQISTKAAEKTQTLTALPFRGCELIQTQILKTSYRNAKRETGPPKNTRASSLQRFKIAKSLSLKITHPSDSIRWGRRQHPYSLLPSTGMRQKTNIFRRPRNCQHSSYFSMIEATSRLMGTMLRLCIETQRKSGPTRVQTSIKLKSIICSTAQMECRNLMAKFMKLSYLSGLMDMNCL